MANDEPQTSLVELPEPCLLAVLQCLADDQVSLCSAARAHSRLHQTAVAALSSFRAAIRTQQQISDSLVPYLYKHGQHVSSMQLAEAAERKLLLHQTLHLQPLQLQQLPGNVQFTSLSLDGLSLQLQPGDGFEGVLGPAALGLKQLRLSDCRLLDGTESLAAALPLLPGLEHLTISGTPWAWQSCMLPTQLTYLSLELHVPDPYSYLLADSALPCLQQLSQLRHLQLCIQGAATLNADVLSAQSNLTYLLLTLLDDSLVSTIAPAVLAGKTQLQHLAVSRCRVGRYHGDATGVAHLLSQLQHLQQLTHLDLSPRQDLSARSWSDIASDYPPASAFSALAASSKLQYLDISYTQLPDGVWPHVFPDASPPRLPYLQSLYMSQVNEPTEDPDDLGCYLAPPEGSRLVSCCPGLQALDVDALQYSPELMEQLTGLTGLQTLSLDVPVDSEQHAVDCIRQLTGLRRLDVSYHSNQDAGGPLLQLTQLQQLTALNWHAIDDNDVELDYF